MKESIKSFLELRGLQLPEQRSDQLVERWLYFLDLKQNVKSTTVHTSDISLRFVPQVGFRNE